MPQKQIGQRGAEGSRVRGRPKKSSDDQQRAQIVAGAHDLFVEEGYAATTMDLIAARCGISKRTLYRLFPAKVDLFRAVIASHRRSMLALPRPDDDMPLDEALFAIFRFDSDERDLWARLAFIRLAMAEAERFPEVREALTREGTIPSQTMLADWLARQQERGRIEISDPRAVARILMDMMFGGLAERFPGDAGRTHEERLQHARRCIAIFLHGVMVRDGGASRSQA